MGALILLALLFAAVAGASAPGPAQPGIQGRGAVLRDGTRIHYLEAGRPGARPALVLIPGWTLPAFLWKEQLQRFSSDRLVLAIDPRSQGESSKTDLGNTPEQRARDLHELLSTRGVRSAVVVGWSQGANDLAAYVQQFGTTSIAGLAFVDSPVSAGPAEIEIHKEWSRRFLGMLALYENHPAEYSERMIRSLFARPHPGLDLKAVIAHSRETPVSIGLSMLVMDIFAVDRRPALAKINRPTLVIASAESPLLEAQRSMAHEIAGATFLSIRGAGHALFIDDPETFDRALARLLVLADHDSSRQRASEIHR